MPNPTVFDENFADVKFFGLHKCAKKSKVIIFLVRRKLIGRTGLFNDDTGFYCAGQRFLLSDFEIIVSDLRLFFWK
jgi:hypothetical protein